MLLCASKKGVSEKTPQPSYREPQKWEFCHFGAKMALLRQKKWAFLGIFEYKMVVHGIPNDL